MMTGRTGRMLTLMGAVAVGMGACDDTTTIEPETTLLSVAPAAGAVDVATDAPIEVTFDRPMGDHATDYADLHRGDVNGPMVGGEWSMQSGGMTLHFTPHEPLEPGTEYTLHLGGGMMDADGHPADMESHGTSMGGMWADGGMMSGGMGSHMGNGWQDKNGSYGMVFSFTTAGTAATALVAVAPQGGDTGVDPRAPVVVTFNHAIDPAMAEYAALHEGDVTGPEVPGTWTLSEDSTQLIFTQDEPLKAGTRYTIHLGGGMMDAEGHHVDMDENGTHMGGEWATGSMMGGGMSGGMSGGEHNHMGQGWEHPDNGSYGMIFTFTIAA